MSMKCDFCQRLRPDEYFKENGKIYNQCKKCRPTLKRSAITIRSMYTPTQEEKESYKATRYMSSSSRVYEKYPDIVKTIKEYERCNILDILVDTGLNHSHITRLIKSGFISRVKMNNAFNHGARYKYYVERDTITKEECENIFSKKAIEESYKALLSSDTVQKLDEQKAQLNEVIELLKENNNTYNRILNLIGKIKIQ